MCGRIVLSHSPEDIAEFFRLANAPFMAPRFNIPPGGPIAAVVCGDTEKDRVLKMFNWGLVPPGPRNVGSPPRLINARAETIASKTSFADSFANRRCLIPVDGYFEWKRQGGKGQPYLIRRPDKGLFALAGIWQRWEYPGGKVHHSCAIVTTAAADFMRPIHHRMPVVIKPESWQTWLVTPATEATACENLMRQQPDDLITHPVDPRVGDPNFNQPACLEPWQPGHDGQLDMFKAKNKDEEHE